MAAGFIGVSLALLFVVGVSGWLYLKGALLDFEGDYSEQAQINSLTVDGFRFLDRNGNGALDVYEDERVPIPQRVDDLLSQMTLDEKIHVLKGSGLASATGTDTSTSAIPGAVGTIVPTPRLGIPTVYLSDGPAGLRIAPTREADDRTYYATAFPNATLLASTWSELLVEQVGRAMGDEALRYGIDVILGPGVNIHRHPLTGRNFEYYSEDPVLSGLIAAAMVNGIEANGVGSSVKHFIANNQETSRTENDAMISERALREIYLKNFELIVKRAQPWTIMSSYNKVNGAYTSESRRLLTDILRNEWGFKGIVMSDWFGGQDAAAQITAGNDLLEPGTKMQWQALQEAAESGALSLDVIDIAVRRIMSLVFDSQKMRGYSYQNDPDLEAHAQVTRQSASEGMVLLKNADVLPLASTSTVALLGITSYDFIAGGTGSGDVNEAYTISLEAGLRNAGFKLSDVAREAYLRHRENNAEQFVKPEGIDAMFNPYVPPEMTLSAMELEKISADADVAIVTIGRNSGEGGDRREQGDFLLTETEREMIANTSEAFHAAGKSVVVVLNIGGVIETASWKSQADAILLAWQGGQEGGNSVADILNGSVNPSGKLPVTFPVNLADHASDANFPHEGEPISMPGMLYHMLFKGDVKAEADRVENEDYTHYAEGIYVGYRHFDKAQLDVSYPFGFGLSLTEFEFNDLVIQLEDDRLLVDVVISNMGARTGKEVVQVYSAKPGSDVDRPVRELKGFAKTSDLHSGDSETVHIEIPISELSYWDEGRAGWVLEPGTYRLDVGNSSRNILLSALIELGGGNG